MIVGIRWVFYIQGWRTPGEACRLPRWEARFLPSGGYILYLSRTRSTWLMSEQRSRHGGNDCATFTADNKEIIALLEKVACKLENVNSQNVIHANIDSTCEDERKKS